MKVSAVIPTRGNVSLDPILDSLPASWDVVVWNNASADPSHGSPRWHRWSPNTKRHYTYGYGGEATDLGPHGRFAAIEHATGELIVAQDDDVVVSDPQAIVDAHMGARDPRRGNPAPSWKVKVTCNMPASHRSQYPDPAECGAMVGFGACFARDVPELAFQRFFARWPHIERTDPMFLRESCRIVTTLSPVVYCDIAKEDREFASDLDRLWKQPNHNWYRQKMVEMARAAR